MCDKREIGWKKEGGKLYGGFGVDVVNTDNAM